MQNQDMVEIFMFDLGFECNVKIYEYNINVEEIINDVCLFDDDELMEKGQFMFLFRWCILCDFIEIIDKNLEDVKKDKDVDYCLYFGGNVYVLVIFLYRFINICKCNFMRNVELRKKIIYLIKERDFL